ncbi:MAG TPA: DHH family phosphoesterase [Thiobacillus sp.]|nr:MAG: acetyltransferase [Hydrogenophilales bacterium 16-64-40]OZA33980.1 MAG: acetyltransferase [Hydrogenophilales bacterium 17-64-65]HQS82449.1 DHH family phosphoesterase [Thiobacillus sp.]HQT33921.1 DHH family phosphoesterase [Thiobacillus sp.]
MQFDVFNGDADGVCALHQMRLVFPCESTLITGPKRDISLLKRVDASGGDDVLVLDVALSKNRDALDKLLEAGVQVRYFDHHQPGDIPAHPNFESHIDTDANVCTSLLVNRHLQGRQQAWAVTGAFGDNLADAARQAAAPLDLSAGQLAQLQSLGECLNYNGYGDTLDDLFFDPADLYRQLRPFANPFAFLAESPAYQTLKTGYQDDMARAVTVKPTEARATGRIFMLPAEKWARRISGVFGNQLAVGSPAQAHAVLTAKAGGGYIVSVRAPLVARSGADELCSQFDSGGGRRGAAGINHLPEGEIGRFIALFFQTFG